MTQNNHDSIIASSTGGWTQRNEGYKSQANLKKFEKPVNERNNKKDAKKAPIM